jgi:methylated-DNA-[protein]-cysteine S-methyltransferase
MVAHPILIGRAVTARLGPVWVATSPMGLVAVEFGVSPDRFRSLVRKLTHADARDAQRQLLGLTQQIKEYVEGRRRAFDLSIDWSFMPSEFQRKALRAVLAIPYGQTRTYGQIAAQIGYPLASRAVGRANATNPMPLVIPCHRVIGSDGRLHGYGGVGGLRTKAWLLKMEGVLG